MQLTYVVNRLRSTNVQFPATRSVCVTFSPKKMTPHRSFCRRVGGASGPLFTHRVLLGRNLCTVCPVSLLTPPTRPAASKHRPPCLRSRIKKSRAKSGPRATYSYLRRVQCTFGANQIQITNLPENMCRSRPWPTTTF